MAPEGTARPGALSLPGMRNSALASAALTSVALLGQTAGAAPSSSDEAPSREEVSRRINSLYDRAETDSGTFNATRAASTGPRKRGPGPGDAGIRAGEGTRSDPALDNVSRQWFDMARAKLGPTVPAALPRDRTPDRPVERRPARAMQDLSPARESTGRAPLALPAAPARELTSGRGTGVAPLAELTAGPVAALPAAPAAPADLQATQVMPAALALPAGNPSASAAVPATGSAADPQTRDSLRTTKEQNRRKLDRARELLSRYATGQSAAPAAIAALPASGTWASTQAQPSADDRWQALQAQSAADLTTVPPGATARPTAAPATDSLTTTITDPYLGTLTVAPPATVTDPYLGTVTTATPQSAAPDTITDPYLGTLTVAPPATVTDPYLGTVTTATPQSAAPDTITDPYLGTLTVAPPPAPADVTAPGTATALTATASHDTRAIRALEFARAQVGKPCVWGTTGPEAFDGPGLTQAAWKAAGITLPRTAPEQATAGEGVDLARLEPGDLVLFHAGHVGIYSGNGMMIHAPGPGVLVREESIQYAGEAAIHSAIRPA
ncbi:C40 family peptidase [Streptomyces sp. KS_5]|uniref:C40 family peptidase n=1 Tax=Streptomyces sp. KS_5 TaxID=1881018 RepID=UPI0008977253|nr:C40 family peptidase [Streptomyces sp. KS_5]SED97171.1 Cell wall-associated hydrolase, NlpC family [Streptomyces sp. KS_5]